MGESGGTSGTSGRKEKTSEKASGELPDTFVEDHDLTEAQREVLKLIHRGWNTPEKLAKRRDCTKRAIRYHLQELREKGLINQDNMILPEAPHTPGSGWKHDPTVTIDEQERGSIRLHGEHFVVEPVMPGEKYDRYVGKDVLVDGNTVRVHDDRIEIYSNKSFFAEGVREATGKAVQYWTKFLRRLERVLGNAILLKERSNNVERVQAHYAEVGNELSRDAREEGEHIRVYAEDDGKLWFEIDNSLELDEAETTHPRTAERDMAETVRPVFNWWRREGTPLPEESWEVLNAALEAQQRTDERLDELSEHVKQLGAGLNTIVKTLANGHEQERDAGVQTGGVPFYVR